MIDIGINDSQLLEHISVDYVNLPNYMRNNWSTYCKKNILKELLKKSSNFTKTNDNIDKTNQNTLLDTQDLYVCLYLYDNKVGLFKKIFLLTFMIMMFIEELILIILRFIEMIFTILHDQDGKEKVLRYQKNAMLNK